MISVGEVAFGSEDYLAAVEIRREVLRRPLGLDYTPAQLATDEGKTILVAKLDDRVVGTLMLTDEGSGSVRMRAVAVLPNLQGSGIGRSLVEASENVARRLGFRGMFLHARDHAVGFYDRLGYVVESEPFVEVSIPHRLMTKSL
jgi:ribosomal protein S18 acetylase RimI-like enzyme